MVKELLDQITKTMEEELLSSVKYSDGTITIEVTKAAFKPEEVPELDKEAKGIDDVDDADLFWSAGK